jgi:hypothetical protein
VDATYKFKIQNSKFKIDNSLLSDSGGLLYLSGIISAHVKPLSI